MHWSQAMPQFHRMMIFVDGENLVFRYQQMLRIGRVHRCDNVTHEPDVIVWHPTFTDHVGAYEVIRAIYYTCVVGDDDKVDRTREQIKNLPFNQHRQSIRSCFLTPKVFKKAKKHAKAKGVDISMTVDVLSNVHHDNVDTILLLSGDGDYVPLVEEVQRYGKLCYVSAFSNGLSDNLRLIADQFRCLDGTMFSD